MPAFALGLVPLAVLVAAILVIVGLRRSRHAEVADSSGGKRVPLVASFGSKRAFGPFGGSHNSLNPLLVLNDDGFEYRVVRRKTALYSEIARVDAFTAFRTANVIIEFRNSGFTFTGNTGKPPILAEVLRFLAGKGCPLSERARAIAEAHPES